MTEMIDDVCYKDLPNPTTICRDCVFATWDGESQEDCGLGRLDAFEDNGAEIVGLDDGNRRYFAVAGRFCNTCRNHDWGRDHPRQDWVADVLAECETKVHFVVYVGDESDFADVVDSIGSIYDQVEVKPAGITVVVNGGGHDPRRYARILRDVDRDIRWNVKETVADDDGVYPGRGDALDQAVLDVKDDVTFYSVGNAGYRWDRDYLAAIDESLNRKMMRFVAVEPTTEDGSGLLMDVRLHKYLLGGNKGRGVLDKLKEVVEEEGKGYQVRTLEGLR